MVLLLRTLELVSPKCGCRRICMGRLRNGRSQSSISSLSNTKRSSTNHRDGMWNHWILASMFTYMMLTSVSSFLTPNFVNGSSYMMWQEPHSLIRILKKSWLAIVAMTTKGKISFGTPLTISWSLNPKMGRLGLWPCVGFWCTKSVSAQFTDVVIKSIVPTGSYELEARNFIVSRFARLFSCFAILV